MASIQSYILKFVIRKSRFYYSNNSDIKIVRARSDRAMMLFRSPRNVKVVNSMADAVPCEWLIPRGAPKDRVLLYIHGGAWVMGSAKTHRRFVSRLAFATGIRALSIDYRLAPEHPFPEGLEDCVIAYDWLLKQGINPSKIVIAGDSAGGNLTLSTLVVLRDQGKPLPAGAVALSPATDLAFTGESIITRKHVDPFFADVESTEVVDNYLFDNDPRNPLVSPLYADLTGLPPLLLHVGSDEILLDDTVRFGNRAVAAGVKTETIVWPNMFHVFQMTAPVLPEAKLAIRHIVAFIRSRLEDDVYLDEKDR